MGFSFKQTSGVGSAGVGFLLFFTLFWCGITGVFVGIMGTTAYRVVDAKLRFLPVAAEVTASRIETSRGSKGGTNYKPVVEYKYAVGGREYRSDRYEFMAMSSSSGQGSAERVVAKCPAGAKITAYYDPAHPESAVMVREFPDMLFFMALFLQPFILVGIGMMIATGLAIRDAFRGRGFRNGSARNPPWPIPGWGVWRQEPGGAFAVRGGGRVQATAMAFAFGYGLTCFISIFVVAFGFLLALGGRYGVATPAGAAFALALAVGAWAALRAWNKGDPNASFTFQPVRGRVTLGGGEHKKPLDLRLDEIAGFIVRSEWRTQKTKNGATEYEVFLPRLMAMDEHEHTLCELRGQEDADRLVAEFAQLLGKPVEKAPEEAEDDGSETSADEAIAKFAEKHPVLGKLATSLAKFAKDKKRQP